MEKILVKTVPADVPETRVTKKNLTSDHPTWCPACGDYAVLATFYRILEKLQYPHESIVTLSGIGCSSRFPYFVNTHSAHFLHGRAVPFACGVSLSRKDLHVFVFGGDGDGFSIGGNHLDHAARKNIDLTYVIMDNAVYGLTKNQTSPTSPLGYRSKTDPMGSVDCPVNPMKKLIVSGATFVARTHASQVKHMTEMIDRAARHQGFSVVEILSECIMFNKGSFDAANPRKGGEFKTIQLRNEEDDENDSALHDPTSEMAALTLAEKEWPGVFGIFYEVNKPTKNYLEYMNNSSIREKQNGDSDLEHLQNSFRKLR